MAINFPDSPNNGDSFTSNNKTWVFDGTVWNITSGTNSVADGAITTAKLASNAVHQTKLASNLSAITVTTTANRGTDVASPFTGQTIYLSDVKRLQVWDGSAWMFITNGAPGAPTALSATPLSATSVSIAFTTGTINGSAVTNYKYAYSSNGGSTYSEFAALDPADITSPVVISGLTQSTTYLIKLRAVSDFGDSVDSSTVSVTTLTAPAAPTSLSSIAGNTAVGISFTAGADNGSAITNYEYALSTNSGSTYGAFTALSPVDATSPIVVSGLSPSTTYYIKLRAVSAAGVSPESSAVSATTTNTTNTTYLLIAGGGGGGSDTDVGGGGGAGGMRTGTNQISVATSYAVVVGAGGARGTANYTPGTGGGGNGAKGGDSSIYGLTSVGGGYGGTRSQAGGAGGSGGGGGDGGAAGGAGTAGQGNAGGTAPAMNSNAGWDTGGGGGAGSAGNSFNAGAGLANSITGTSRIYAGGGRGHQNSTADTVAGFANSGFGGNGENNGAAGVVILRYPISYTITLGVGLVGSTTEVGTDKVTTITSGSGNVSWA